MADITDKTMLEKIIEEHSFVAIFHCAAILAQGNFNKNQLWNSNVTATQHLVDLALLHSIPKILFTSSNCLWAKNFNRPVLEADTPAPIEIYGEFNEF